MRERFKKMPQALQKQVVFQFGGGVLCWIVGIIILSSFRDIYLILPALLFAGYLTSSSTEFFREWRVREVSYRTEDF